MRPKEAKKALRLAGSGDCEALRGMVLAAAAGTETLAVPAPIIVCADADGCQPLHRAAAAGHVCVVRYLLASAVDPDCRKSKSKTPLHEAAAAGRTEVIGLLLAAGALISAHKTNGWTPLMYSCAAGDTGGATLLLTHGANLRDRNRDGQTGFYLACREGHRRLAEQLLAPSTPLPPSGNTPYVLPKDEVPLAEPEPLLAMRTRNMKTALHGAASNGHTSVLQMLLSHGADAEATGKSFTLFVYSLLY